MTDLAKQIDQALGGAYELSDGRSFWIDHLAAKEIVRRVLPVMTAALASPAATGEPVGWIAYTQKGAFVAHITRRETAAEFSSDGFIVRGIYDIAPAQPGPSAEVRVKATLEALRVEAADDHFHDAWQQGVRYAVAEISDALTAAPAPAVGEPVAWVWKEHDRSLGAEVTRFANHWSTPPAGATPLYAHPSEALAAATERAQKAERERDEARQLADDLAWAEKKRDDYAAMLTAAEVRIKELAQNPGTYFANLLGYEWIGSDGIRYETTKTEDPKDPPF